MNINGIELLNTISQQILFATVGMIKNRKVNNIEDGIKQVNTLYLQLGLNFNHIHTDSEFEPLWT